MTIPPRISTERSTENQNLVDDSDVHERTQGPIRQTKLPHRFMIFGTSLKKLERSTSFFVAPHVILYENKCARIAWLKGMLSPPKKKKLELEINLGSDGDRWMTAHKNGTQDRFVKSDVT